MATTVLPNVKEELLVQEIFDLADKDKGGSISDELVVDTSD